MNRLIENKDFIVNFLVIWGFIQSLYFSVFMGLILRWNDARGEQRTKVGKLWHGQATLLKVGIPVLWIPTYFVLPLQTWGIIAIGFVWFSWVGWDGILNMCRLTLNGNRLQRFFYSGTAKTGTTSIIELWMYQISHKIKILRQATYWVEDFIGGFLPFMKLVFTIISVAGMFLLLMI